MGASWPSSAPGQPQQPADPQTGTVTDIRPRQPPGILKVRQKRGDTFADATIGMLVRRGYSLRVAAGGGATIVCADNRKFELGPGPHPCPCADPGRLTSHEGTTIPRPRGADTANSTFPVIISPRGTLLLSTRPTLRWAPIKKFDSQAPAQPARPAYSVEVYTDDMRKIWGKNGITTTELAYPADVPELTAGEYLLVVTTGDRSSTQETGAGQGFTVLPKCPAQPARNEAEPCLARVIQEAATRIRQLGLPDDSTRLLIADLYTSYELYAEAIEQLEEVLKTTREPAILRRAGDLYASIGLSREAEGRYLEALGLPQINSDPETLGMTLYTLALTYEQLGSLAQARTRYDEAIRAYEKIRDDQTVTELKNRRAQLDTRRPETPPRP